MIYLRLAVVAGVLALLYSLYWYVDHTGYVRGRNEVIQADIEHERNSLLAYAERIKKSEEQNAKYKGLIDRLAADAGRVRVHLPVCPQPAGTTQGENGGAGVLSNRVDEAFADFQRQVGELVKRCDELNLDSIKSNTVTQH